MYSISIIKIIFGFFIATNHIWTLYIIISIHKYNSIPDLIVSKSQHTISIIHNYFIRIVLFFTSLVEKRRIISKTNVTNGEVDLPQSHGSSCRYI